MQPEKKSVALVTIDSSDEDDDVRLRVAQAVKIDGNYTPAVSPSSCVGARNTPPQLKQSSGMEPATGRSPGAPVPECRSFWKAGDYDVGAGTMISAAPGMLEHARIHPKFLHSNATSHKWAFGAIAELIDNAVDEVHNGAAFVKVDKINIMKDKSPALLFHDDGGGMDPDGLRKCMSLGYSSKKTNSTIGQCLQASQCKSTQNKKLLRFPKKLSHSQLLPNTLHLHALASSQTDPKVGNGEIYVKCADGNGFKTSTMRLGADVIVFSRAVRYGRATQSVGLLSYTFLRRTGQDDVIVPMIDFDISDHWAQPITYGSESSWSSNLKLILDWSPFASKEELLRQFEDLESHGTKIIIYNLWLNDEGIYELNFDDDDKDIRLRDETNQQKLNQRNVHLQSHISYRLRFSLRAYASMLYLKKFTNFQIILRGSPIEQHNITNYLMYPQVVTYRPQVSPITQITMETTIGFMQEASDLGISGFNVYHKNRLVRPFWKVISDGTSRGFGIIGVLEANFIEPAHDKQDFERSPIYVRLETRLKQMHSDYLKSNSHLFDHPRAYNINKVRKGLSGERPTGPSVNMQRQSGSEYSPGRRQSNYCLGYDNVSLEVHVPTGHGVIPAGGGGDGVESVSFDQICEEKIQLFIRCEEHKQKEAELKDMISKVEKELEETQSKCASLSSHIEMQRKRLLSVRPYGKS